MLPTLRTLATALFVIELLTSTLHADVASVEILERQLLENGRRFGDSGAYEELVGRITFAIDPANLVNQVIVGLDRAPQRGHPVGNWASQSYHSKIST